MMRSTLLSVALAVGAVAFTSSCSLQNGTTGGSTPVPGRYSAAPAMSIDVSKTYVATITTSRGVIELTLDAQAAPRHVNNFVFLAREKFYDGLVFHRVEPGFVVQGGDPAGDGSGGPGYAIDDEASPLLHEAFSLGMAKSSAPNSAGSQFYITLAKEPALDNRYTVFGKVTAGIDVVTKIVKGDAMQTVVITEK